MPDLRYGIGADDARSRRYSKSRTARHDLALLGRCRALGAVIGLSHGRAFRQAGPRRPYPASAPRLGGTGPRPPVGAVGWLAVFPARLGFDREPPAQYVYLD